MPLLRSLALAGVLATAIGCNQTVAADYPAPAQPLTGAMHVCAPEGYEGRRVLADGEALKSGSNDIDPKTLPRPYRVISPGQPVTMDYSPKRLNLEINDQRVVVKAKCG